MTDYDDEGKGSLWPNDRRESERHPHYRGQCQVGQIQYWVSAWVNESDNPKAPALRFQLSPKEAVAQQGAAQVRQSTGLTIPPVVGQAAQRPAAAMPDAQSRLANSFEEDSDIPFN